MCYPEPASGDFLAGFMDDYFAECDEHLTAVRRHPRRGAAGTGARPAVRCARRAVSQLSLDQGPLGDGAVARRRTARASHGKLSAAAAQPRGAFHGAGLDGLINGTSLLERVIAARRSNQPGPSIRAGRRAARCARRQLRIADCRRRTMTDGAPAPDHGAAERSAALATSVFDPSPERAARGITVDRVRAPLQEVGGHRRRGADASATRGAIRFEFTWSRHVSDADVVSPGGSRGWQSRRTRRSRPAERRAAARRAGRRAARRLTLVALRARGPLPARRVDADDRRHRHFPGPARRDR